jgi:uncharacterized protein YcbK (DUF882 family)
VTSRLVPSRLAAGRLLLLLMLGSTFAFAEPAVKSAPVKSKPSPTPSHVGGYADQVTKWHAPVEAAIPVDDAGRPLLALSALNTGEHIELRANGDHGGFSASDLDRLAFFLRDPRAGTSHPVEPRLIDLVYELETHFQSREIRVISGYRTPHGRSGSNHGKGRAIDLVVSGTTDADAAAYARTLGFVGVGIYPTSGFVHVDVRDRSYFWSDSSGPGRKNRERGILGEVAEASDRAALAAGGRPPPRFGLLLDVDKALLLRGVSPVDMPERGSLGGILPREEEDVDTEETP